MYKCVCKCVSVLLRVSVCVDTAQVVQAAEALLSDLPEYAPEQLLSSLEPHMLQVAAAALQAASGDTGDGMHAAAWVAAFSAYVAALPDKLVASEDVDPNTGHQLRQALLQVGCGASAAALCVVCTCISSSAAVGNYKSGAVECATVHVNAETGLMNSSNNDRRTNTQPI